MDRIRWKDNIEIAPNCPRCASSNTKFCYYNNYSLSQPRYFCKGCRRYWTKGGSLRNLPVGGGCRRNRRPKSSRLDSQSTSTTRSKNDCSDSTDHSKQPQGGTNRSDIDLAVVFARFLNDNNRSAGSPDSLNPDQIVHSEGMYESGQMIRSLDHVIVDQNVSDSSDQFFFDGIPDVFGDQEIVGNDDVNNNEFRTLDQTILGTDQIMGRDQDVVTLPEAINLPNFTCIDDQPVVHFQELDQYCFGSSDRFGVSEGFVGDNWSSFDLSGFEIFSTPNSSSF